ncbi:MAG: hypothetical protein IJW49_02225 [Clostridia bacterium]|nr:hypothetical protein [Clostridia bacterium]
MNEQKNNFVMTLQTMGAFIKSEGDKGASENMIRRLKAAVKMLYDFLPKDKQITRERLLEWRTDMNEKGKDISGMKFGFITAIEPTDKRGSRGARTVPLWECRCECGAICYKATDTLSNPDFSMCNDRLGKIMHQH